MVVLWLVGVCTAQAMPTVTLTAPANNSTFVPPASISLSATASDSSYAIDHVEFYQGNTLVATSTTSPYTATWGNVAAGTYSITAKAYNAKGESATSTAATVVVQPLPGWKLTRNPSPMIAGQPFSYTWSLTNATSWSMTCTAAGSGWNGSNSGTTSSGGGSGTASGSWVGYPSDCWWTVTGPGGTAKYLEKLVTLNQGNSAKFISQNVPSKMNPGATYPVLLTFMNTGTTTWSAGSSFMLGAQNPTDNTSWGLKRVTLANSVAPGDSYTFSFNVTAPTTNGAYHFQWRMLQDPATWFGDLSTDVYVTVGTVSPPTLTLTRTPAPMLAGQPFTSGWTATNASSISWVCTASGTGYNGSQSGLPATGSVTATASSAWVGYPSSCTWTVTGPGGTATFPQSLVTVSPPTVSITQPTTNSTYGSSVKIPLTATASENKGTIAKVEFYSGTTLLGTATTAPYTVNWSTAVAGTYTITAKATDTQGITATSSPITVNVLAAPQVTLTVPTGTRYEAPASMSLRGSAQTARSDITVANMAFYNGQALLGTTNTAPYQLDLSSVAAGDYTLTAVATDSMGGIGTSSPVALSVVPNQVSVSLSVDKTSAPAPATILLTAAASSSNGGIDHV